MKKESKSPGTACRKGEVHGSSRRRKRKLKHDKVKSETKELVNIKPDPEAPPVDEAVPARKADRDVKYVKRESKDRPKASPGGKKSRTKEEQCPSGDKARAGEPSSSEGASGGEGSSEGEEAPVYAQSKPVAPKPVASKPKAPKPVAPKFAVPRPAVHTTPAAEGSASSSSSAEDCSSEEASSSSCGEVALPPASKVAGAKKRRPASPAEPAPAWKRQRSALNAEQQHGLEKIIRNLRRVQQRRAQASAAPGNSPTGVKKKRHITRCVVGATGTGKSHLLRCVLAAAAAERAACVAAAFTAKAAHALGGQTVHTLCGLRERGRAGASAAPSRENAKRLRDADLIVVDDAGMMLAPQLDAVSSALTRGGFSGVLLLAVNPAALPQVQPGGTVASRLANSCHSAQSWPSSYPPGFTRGGGKIVLTKQMRIKDEELADSIHALATGAASAEVEREHSSDEGCVQTVRLPRGVFEPVASPADAHRWLRDGKTVHDGSGQRAWGMVMCTTNAQVSEHNSGMLCLHPGSSTPYPCLPHKPRVKESDDSEGRIFTPTSTITPGPSNFEAELALKVGVPVRLTCNVCPEVGLFTDALATVVGVGRNTVTVRLAEPGPGGAGDVRLGRACFDGDYQFPLKLGWAVTAHHAAAFTPARVVVDLRKGCWCHGQLAVMLSRARRSRNLRVLHDPVDMWSLARGDRGYATTSNVVLKEVVAG